MRMRDIKREPLKLAHLLHRVSGVALALFLPAHFLLLAMTVTDAAQADALLAYGELPLVKLAEGILVFLLAVHLAGGLRLLALEFMDWTGSQKGLAAAAVGVSFCAAGLFLLRAI